MITIAVCLAFLILAGLNAFFSQSPHDFVLNEDDDYFLPPVMKAEGVYRSFVINVAFLGIAIVIGGFQFGSSTHFNISGAALLALAANLAWGFFAAICLRSDSRQLIGRNRRRWVIAIVGVSLVLFAFSVATVYQTTHSKSEASQIDNEPQEDGLKNGQEEIQDG